MTGRLGVTISALLLVSACTTATIDLDEPRRIVGTQADVRVDAQVFAEKVGTGSSVRVLWEIDNQRPDPIAVAELLPAVTYDEAARTIVVSVGSEVPGNELLPRLIRIESGEKKMFDGLARIAFRAPPPGPFNVTPRYLQLKVNFLANVEPFKELIGIPEVAVHDAQRADDLFAPWVEANETVQTNAIPIEWIGSVSAGGADVSRR